MASTGNNVGFSYKAPKLNDDNAFETYNKAYPGFDKDDYQRLEKMANSLGLKGQAKKDKMDELYMRYYDQVINKHKLDQRQQVMKEQAFNTKDLEGNDKAQQQTRIKLADLSQKAKKKFGIDAGINDETIINDMTNSIPNGGALLKDYINNGNKEYLYKAGLETGWEKAEDVAVGALQSGGKRGYNLMGQWVDRLGKKIADKLEGTSVAEWIQKKAVEEFGEDAVKEFGEQRQKELEEGTAFNGRKQTDITKPILGETRSENGYTKAGEVIGDIASGIAVTAPLAAATAPMYASATAGGAATLGAIEGAIGAGVSKVGATGEGPDLKDLAIGGVTGIAGGLFSRYLQNLPKNKAEDVRKQAETYINKSIKPTVKGKMNQADYDKFIDDTLDVTNFMNKNKNLLEYTDDVGEKVTGELPKNLRETSEALSNLKKSLYDAYNDIATQAGDKGARVSLNKVYDNLDDLEKSVSQNLGNTKSKNVIEEFKRALIENSDDMGTISIADAQKTAQEYNQQLTAFFKNAANSSEDVSTNAIKAKINMWLKNAIDDSISDTLDNSIKGAGTNAAYYKDLKGMYSKIKTIEDEIAKRALVDARKNTKGLSSSVLDAFAGGDITEALLTADVGKLGKGTVLKAISKYYNYLNDPNVQINNLFKLVENGGKEGIISQATNAINTAVKSGLRNTVKPNVIESAITATEEAVKDEE